MQKFWPLLLLLIFACQNKEGLIPRDELTNTPPASPAPSPIQNVYSVSMINTIPAYAVNRTYIGELGSSDYTFAYVFENNSQKLIDGVFDEYIPTLPPQFVPTADTSLNTINNATSGNPLCRTLTILPPQGRCEIIVNLSFVPPAPQQRVTPAIFDINFISPGTTQTYQGRIEFEGIVGLQSTKTIVGTGLRSPYDYNFPALTEFDGETAGRNLVVASMASGTVTTVGPCSINPDGSPGNPRGIYPFYSRGFKDSVVNIGNKVYFSGRGCSWNGSSLVMERYGVWEYDSDLPVGPTNPRRISRDASGVAANGGVRGSAPLAWMESYNGKLYFSAVSETFGVLDSFGWDRQALFEYDPTQPFVPGVNPLEINTNYPASTSSFPRIITFYDNKVYFVGDYYLTTQGYTGIIEYDPSKPINLNNLNAIEASDNPRFVWGFDSSQYMSYQFNIFDYNTFIVDEDFYVLGARLPADLLNPSLTQSPNGKEIHFIRKSDLQVTSFDLCPGSCDSDPNRYASVGDYYVIDARHLRPDLSDNRTVFVLQKSGVPGLKTVSLSHVNDVGSVENIPIYAYDFQIVSDGTKAYFGLKNDATKNLYMFDSTTGTTTELFSTIDFQNGQDGFKNLKFFSNNILSWLAENPLLPGRFYLAFYDTTMPVMQTSPNLSYSNPLNKFNGYFLDSFEDNENIYLSLQKSCAGVAGLYIDLISKHKDYRTYTSSSRFPSLCSNPRPDMIQRILFSK